MLEPNNTGNHKKWSEPHKMLIFEQRALRSQTTLETIKSEGNHPKCWFVQRTLWSQTTLGTIKVKGTIQNVDFEWQRHWSPTTLGTIKNGTTQNIDFEQEARWSQTTLETITGEGNHPIIMIGQKCCSNTYVFPTCYNGWIQTNVSQSEGRSWWRMENLEGQISATIAKPGVPDFGEVYQYADLFVLSFTVHLYTWKILRT